VPRSSYRPSLVLSRTVVGAGAASLALLLAAAVPSQAAAGGCAEVRGFYVEHVVTENCLSPVGLCIAGTYSGRIRGDFEGRASRILTTADTPTTRVAMFTSDSTVDATVDGRSGRLIIKNAGSFSTTGGAIVDLQTIVGGTGELSGATGALRAQGTFSATTGGRSRYLGTLCLP
jgi:hypothetical protein